MRFGLSNNDHQKLSIRDQLLIYASGRAVTEFLQWHLHGFSGWPAAGNILFGFELNPIPETLKLNPFLDPHQMQLED